MCPYVVLRPSVWNCRVNIHENERKVNNWSWIIELLFEIWLKINQIKTNSLTLRSLFVDPQVGRLENAIGWYHSHPGYGCWLSGIDVSTQMLNQQFQEPFVAVVVRRREKTQSFPRNVWFHPGINDLRYVKRCSKAASLPSRVYFDETRDKSLDFWYMACRFSC